jgi:hypothetical protein
MKLEACDEVAQGKQADARYTQGKETHR